MSFVMAYHGNSRTKTKSFLHMSIPLKFINRAVDKLFPFEESLGIAVEIVNDEEFMELATAWTGGVGVETSSPWGATDYILIYENLSKEFAEVIFKNIVQGSNKGIPKIVVKEAKIIGGTSAVNTGGGIIDVCIRGFIDILKLVTGKKQLSKTDDEMFTWIKSAVYKELDSVPRLE